MYPMLSAGRRTYNSDIWDKVGDIRVKKRKLN
jgi:hypothetical protein